MMPFYIASRANGIIDVLPSKIIKSAKRVENIKTGRGYMDMVVQVGNHTDIANSENYILTKGRNGVELYGIVDTSESTASGEVSVYAEDIGLNLINNVAPAYSSSSAMTIEQYIMLFTRLFEIRVNEVATNKRTLAWDGESTIAQRLESIANNFDAELMFSVEAEKLDVVKLYVDIYKKRGQNIAKPLKVGKEIKNIVIDRSSKNVATAILATGKDGLTLSGATYDDGDVYLDQNTNVLLSRSAQNKWWGMWPRVLAGREILKRFAVDTASRNILLTQAVSKLYDIKDEVVKYKATINYLPDGFNVGDTCRIVSDDKKISINARLVELETEKTTGYAKAVFDEYAEDET